MLYYPHRKVMLFTPIEKILLLWLLGSLVGVILKSTLKHLKEIGDLDAVKQPKNVNLHHLSLTDDQKKQLLIAMVALGLTTTQISRLSRTRKKKFYNSVKKNANSNLNIPRGGSSDNVVDVEDVEEDFLLKLWKLRNFFYIGADLRNDDEVVNDDIVISPEDIEEDFVWRLLYVLGNRSNVIYLKVLTYLIESPIYTRILDKLKKDGNNGNIVKSRKTYAIKCLLASQHDVSLINNNRLVNLIKIFKFTSY